ncbi:MAG TPA: hypothetical protein VGC62_06815 [Pseudomonas sp.]|uniref:hypothetical protein n=1 Tax=Pseudomonas sp. TaxID=306 RepID=UPI002ED7ADFB
MPSYLQAILDRNAMKAGCQAVSWQSFLPGFNNGVTPLTQEVSVSGRYRAFVHDDCRITIVRNGPTQVFSQCRNGLFGYNFDDDEPLLLGSLRGEDQLLAPIHLKFSQPVRKVGACISANGDLDDAYIAELEVRIDGGAWVRVVAPITQLSQQRGSAPALGAATTNNTNFITEARFDVIDVNNTGRFRRMAIGQLYFQL